MSLNRYRLSIAFAIISLLSLSGCQTPLAYKAPSKAVYHFVAIWLNDPDDAAAREAIIEVTHAFRGIPGVLIADAGDRLADTRPIVVSDYDIGVLILFESEAALRAYQTHPLHVQASTEVLRPNARKVRVYDFISASM